MKRIWPLLACLWWMASVPVSAHTVSFAKVQLRSSDTGLTATVELPVVDLKLILPELRQPGTLKATDRAEVERLIVPRLRLETSTGTLSAKLPAKLLGASLDTKNLRLSLEYPKPAGELRVSAWLVPENNLHKTFVDVYRNRKLERQLIFDAQTRTQTVSLEAIQSVWEVIRIFVLEGIHHIAIGPDHILFVISLLLAGGSLWTLLRITSAFTLAHSVTLSLATLGVFAPPSSFIEPAIAASIIFVAANSLRPTKRDLRIWFAFGFGLIHGFGFASALKEMQLPRDALAWTLVAFNVGVELGQACIVLTVAPILWWLRTHAAKTVTNRVIGTATWAVIGMAGVWFVERVRSYVIGG